jgi:hypothetical protein
VREERVFDAGIRESRWIVWQQRLASLKMPHERSVYNPA